MTTLESPTCVSGWQKPIRTIGQGSALMQSIWVSLLRHRVGPRKVESESCSEDEENPIHLMFHKMYFLVTLTFDLFSVDLV